ncbi:MAG TPA: hypothetical protein VN324_02310 [Quisquiliibacterium sp.]|nr:hypothetical protein [Quisquiliibacterium sp.]
MLLLKLLLVPAFLALVTLAGRRWGPGVAGWLAGLPVVAGPILFFLAIEHGTVFGARAAAASLSAVLAAIAFSVTYARACRRFGWPVALASALSAWFVAAFMLAQLPESLMLSAVLAGAALLAAPRLLPQGPAVLAARAAPAWELWLRMGAGAALTLAVTGLATGIGPAWSGLFSVFPVLSFVLAVFSQRMHGSGFVIALLRAMATGMWSFAAFCLALALALQILGVGPAFGVSVLATLAVQWLTRRAHSGSGVPRAPPASQAPGGDSAGGPQR